MYHDLPIKNGGSFVDLSIAILTSPENHWVAHSNKLRSGRGCGVGMPWLPHWRGSGVVSQRGSGRMYGVQGADAGDGSHGGWEGGFYITFTLWLCQNSY